MAGGSQHGGIVIRLVGANNTQRSKKKGWLIASPSQRDAIQFPDRIERSSTAPRPKVIFGITTLLAPNQLPASTLIHGSRSLKKTSFWCRSDRRRRFTWFVHIVEFLYLYLYNCPWFCIVQSLQLKLKYKPPVVKWRQSFVHRLAAHWKSCTCRGDGYNMGIYPVGSIGYFLLVLFIIGL